MTGTFIDTIIICNLTGLTLLVTGAWNIGLDGADATSFAFRNGLDWNPQIGAFILMVSLAFFAFTTIIGWDYYSERCIEYLTNGSRTAVKTYRWMYIVAVLAGPFISLSAVWTIADIMNGLMAFPNLLALILLNGVVVAETKSYFSRLEQGRIKEF
jgi:Na+/alanine symporter